MWKAIYFVSRNVSCALCMFAIVLIRIHFRWNRLVRAVRFGSLALALGGCHICSVWLHAYNGYMRARPYKYLRLLRKLQTRRQILLCPSQDQAFCRWPEDDETGTAIAISLRWLLWSTLNEPNRVILMKWWILFSHCSARYWPSGQVNCKHFRRTRAFMLTIWCRMHLGMAVECVVCWTLCRWPCYRAQKCLFYALCMCILNRFVHFGAKSTPDLMAMLVIISRNSCLRLRHKYVWTL